MPRALNLVTEGQVVALPFEHLFGLAADALNEAAVARVAAIKGRPESETGPRPISVILPDWQAIDRVTSSFSPLAKSLAERHWPGALTLVVPAATNLPAPLLSRKGHIGVRLPGPCPAAMLAERSGLVLTATSANRTGEPNARHHEDLAFLEGVSLVVKGSVSGGEGSTVVDASGEQPVVLRQGAVVIERERR